MSLPPAPTGRLPPWAFLLPSVDRDEDNLIGVINSKFHPQPLFRPHGAFNQILRSSLWVDVFGDDLAAHNTTDQVSYSDSFPLSLDVGMHRHLVPPSQHFLSERLDVHPDLFSLWSGPRRDGDQIALRTEE